MIDRPFSLDRHYKGGLDMAWHGMAWPAATIHVLGVRMICTKSYSNRTSDQLQQNKFKSQPDRHPRLMFC